MSITRNTTKRTRIRKACLKSKKPPIPLNYSIGKAILDILLDFGENFPLFESPYQQIRRWHREALGIPAPPRWRYNRAVRYLEQLGQLETVDQNDEVFLRLTKKGKLRALLQKLEKDFQSLPNWDGRWRLIIWDIPESSRLRRNQIRNFLKNLGFYRLQQSVFITPFPLPPAAVGYLRESGLIDFIRFLRVDKIDDDHVLRKYFKLNRVKSNLA